MPRVKALSDVPDGLELLLPLWREFNGEHVGLNELQNRILNSNSIVLLLEGENCTIIGFASGVARSSLLRSSPFFELEAIYIKENFRRAGLGGELISRIRIHAKALRCEAIHVTSIQDVGVLGFYEAQRFYQYGSRHILKF